MFVIDVVKKEKKYKYFKNKLFIVKSLCTFSEKRREGRDGTYEVKSRNLRKVNQINRGWQSRDMGEGLKPNSMNEAPTHNKKGKKHGCDGCGYQQLIIIQSNSSIFIIIIIYFTNK